MPFDFKARAQVRAEKEVRDELRKREAEERRWTVAHELSTSFLIYAQADLNRYQLSANHQGTRAVFTDGGKTAEVIVRDPAVYDVATSIIELPGDTSADVKRARITSDDDLMDMLTAWALNRP